MILVLDNYDSFVYNLDRYLQQLGQRTLVLRSDALSAQAISQLDCQAIVISPGPKTPDDAGCSLEVIRRFATHIPILGVCLGHQAIGQAFGATIQRAPQPVHGRSSLIYHDGNNPLYHQIPTPFRAARYHSLVVDEATLAPELEVTARNEEGLIMSLQHRSFPLVGVQFHPESILTEHGHQLIANFLDLAGILRPSTLPPAENQIDSGPFETTSATDATNRSL